jgi:hypothetical protein
LRFSVSSRNRNESTVPEKIIAAPDMRSNKHQRKATTQDECGQQRTDA